MKRMFKNWKQVIVDIRKFVLGIITYVRTYIKRYPNSLIYFYRNFNKNTVHISTVIICTYKYIDFYLFCVSQIRNNLGYQLKMMCVQSAMSLYLIINCVTGETIRQLVNILCIKFSSWCNFNITQLRDKISYNFPILYMYMTIFW